MASETPVSAKPTSYELLVGWTRFLFEFIERCIFVGLLQFAFNKLSTSEPVPKVALGFVAVLFFIAYLTLITWGISAAAKVVNPFLGRLNAGDGAGSKVAVFAISTVIACTIGWGVGTAINVLIDEMAKLGP